jgi:tetratricopeptide (TPR) repeat protein
MAFIPEADETKSEQSVDNGDHDLRPEDFDEFVNIDAESDEEETETMEDLSPEEIRRMANHHFSIAEVDTALSLYSMAIEKLASAIEQQGGESKASQSEEIDQDLVDQLVVHLCNRSACHFKMEDYEEACADADRAVQLSQRRSLKAAFRFVRAEMALKHFESSIAFLEAFLAPYPNESDNVQKEVFTGEASQAVQIIELRKLLAQARKKQSAVEVDSPITSVKTSTGKPSIKDFELSAQLGAGNFSSIVVCRHKATNEQFALKIIEKKQAETLAKRYATVSSSPRKL